MTAEQYIESFNRRDHEYGLPPFKDLPRWKRRKALQVRRPDLGRLEHAVSIGLLTMREAQERERLNQLLGVAFIYAVAEVDSL